MKQQFWLAVLAYLLPTFPLGYAWHLVTFREAYERLALFRAEVIIPFGITAMIIQALIFAWVYPKLFSTRREQWRRQRRPVRARIRRSCLVVHDTAGRREVQHDVGGRFPETRNGVHRAAIRHHCPARGAGLARRPSAGAE